MYVHSNEDALLHLPYTDYESDICSTSDVSIVANTSLLPVNSPQDMRTKQLQDNIVGPFLRVKETGDQPPSIQCGVSWYIFLSLTSSAQQILWYSYSTPEHHKDRGLSCG